MGFLQVSAGWLSRMLAHRRRRQAEREALRTILARNDEHLLRDVGLAPPVERRPPSAFRV